MSLRWRVLPIMIASVILGFGLLDWWRLYAKSDSAVPWVLAVVGLVVVLWGLIEKTVRTPLLRLLKVERSDDEIHDVAARIAGLEGEAARLHDELEEARTQRQKADLALREHERRYMLAIKGANDGLWEWDIASGAMYLSPRWKGMLGFGVDDIKNHIEAWKAQIHLADRTATQAAIQAAIDGKTARFEVQHRVICRDSTYRWVLSRGTVMRNASGRPYRMIGMDTDISQYRRMEEVLQHVVQGTAGATGEEFFRELVKHFAAVIGVQQAFITECVDVPATRVRPLATWDSDRFIDDPEYALADTPCEAVVRENRTVFYSSGVEARFACSARQGFTSYLGIPIPDRQGRVLGHLAFQGPQPIQEELALESIYKIFVARAAGELERRHAQRVLIELSNGLSQAKGIDSFKMMAKSFAIITAMHEAFVAQCMEHPPQRVRMLAWWRNGEFVAPIEYPVEGSVCQETVLQGRVCHYASGVSRYFNYGDEMGWETYLGVPFFDASGRVIGHFAALDAKAMARPIPDEAVLKLLCERAAIELSRTRLNDTLLDVANTISHLRGVECFRAMVKDLCRVLQIREAFVCECVDQPVSRVRMLARWNRGDFAPCVEFDLSGTACETVVREAEPLYVPRDLGARWPMEKEYERESYLGLPCYDSDGRVIGHIVCTDGGPMPEATPEWAILKLFAERAAIELERRHLGVVKSA